MEFYRYEYKVKSDSVRRVDLVLEIYSLKKETPKGYWIVNTKYPNLGTPIWVSKVGKKRFAYPTKKEALISRIAKSERRLQFLQRDLAVAEEVLNLSKKELEKEIKL